MNRPEFLYEPLSGFDNEAVYASGQILRVNHHFVVHLFLQSMTGDCSRFLIYALTEISNELCRQRELMPAVGGLVQTPCCLSSVVVIDGFDNQYGQCWPLWRSFMRSCQRSGHTGPHLLTHSALACGKYSRFVLPQFPTVALERFRFLRRIEFPFLLSFNPRSVVVRICFRERVGSGCSLSALLLRSLLA